MGRTSVPPGNVGLSGPLLAASVPRQEALPLRGGVFQVLPCPLSSVDGSGGSCILEAQAFCPREQGCFWERLSCSRSFSIKDDGCLQTLGFAHFLLHTRAPSQSWLPGPIFPAAACGWGPCGGYTQNLGLAGPSPGGGLGAGGSQARMQELWSQVYRSQRECLNFTGATR